MEKPQEDRRRTRTKKKYAHTLVLNPSAKRVKQFRTKILQRDVDIQIARDTVSVSCMLTTRNEPKEGVVAWSPVLARGLKAALLLHILLYGKELRVKDVFWQIGDSPAARYPLEDPQRFVYSLLPEKPRRLSDGWKRRAVLDTVLDLSQKAEDYRLAALHAYLMGKSTRMETERFLYLWMAMNGLYEFFFRKIAKKTGYCKETERIKRYQRHYTDQCSFLTDDEREKSADALNRIIFRTRDFQTEIKDPASSAGRQAVSAIRTITGKNYTVDAYFYYLLQQTYTYRCKLFHANRPLKLLSFSEESEIVVLRTLSDLMEEFLDAELHKWFDPEYVETEIEKEGNPKTSGENAASPAPFTKNEEEET